jgi:hypothetical protein
MKDVNQLVVCKDDYETTEDWENAIKKAIMVLLDNNYIMTVRYDEVGIVDISYNPDKQEYGCDYPYWLSPEEIESVVLDEDRGGDE